jgi:cytochrome c5
MKANLFLPFLMVAALAACGEKSAPKAEAPAAAPVASAPAAAPAAPVAAAPAAAAPAPSAQVLAKGEQVYGATCASCHGAGVLGAPKVGDKASWEARIAKGKEALYTSALNGFKMMPPKGGNPALSDEDIKATVDYLVSKAS